MKLEIKSAAIVVLLSTIYYPSTTRAQGSLTPPGTPAPTMKTLSQIEPRTPISSAPFTIATQGSYYLTTNVTTAVSNAIVINASGVTLDLNGFTISSAVASAANGGTAILLSSGLRDITIYNGHIRGGVTNNAGVYSGSGFGAGIYYSGNQPVNVLVSRVTVSGCLNYGIYLNINNATVVENCTARTMGLYGIAACTIKTSSAIDCGSTAIFGDQVADCQGQSDSGSGVYAVTSQNCYGYSVSGTGVYANRTALNCYGYSNGGGTGVYANTAQNCYGQGSFDGIYAINTAENCSGESSAGSGVHATTAQNCYGSSSNGFGPLTDSAQNCYGIGGSGGVIVSRTAQNCRGDSFGTGNGVDASNAENCYGFSAGSGDGVRGDTVTNCRGNSQSGAGVRSSGTAIGCYGLSTTGIGVIAVIANSCVASSTSVSFKYNMP